MKQKMKREKYQGQNKQMSRACLRCEQTKWLCRALKLPGGPKQTENVNSLWDSGPDLNISSDTLCDFFLDSYEYGGFKMPQ